jgi:hypothetical protein
MAKRLLTPEQALKKVELSLKLQGKGMEAEYLGCSHCKFCWANIPGGQPRWNNMIWVNATYIANPNPKPEKANWYCFKYKAAPDHAWIKFRIKRIGKDGVEKYAGNQYYVPRKDEGDVEQVTLWKQEHMSLTRKKWNFKICRRFEATGGK